MLDDSDFAGWYDIIRSENPIKVSYIENSDPAENRVFNIGVGTTDEGVGERPADTSV